MELVVPTALIREVQNQLREKAGLSSYDPGDPNHVPTLPSLTESVALFDPSPPYLRCKRCRGRLPRDLRSVVCVYCGADQKNEVPPDPLSFKSTVGFRWLLQSLDLDGSETVGPPMEESGLHRAQSSSNDDSLSDLLDFEIKWPTKLDDPDNIILNQESLRRNSSLNLTGAELDSFFLGPKEASFFNESEEHLEQSMQIKSEENSAFQIPDQPSFENVQPSDTAVGDENVDNDTGWQAEFQSASSTTLREEFKSSDPPAGSSIDVSSQSFDPSVGSSIDVSSQSFEPAVVSSCDMSAQSSEPSVLSRKDISVQSLEPSAGFSSDISVHMDTVFGLGFNKKSENLEDDSLPSASMTNDWFQDELWNISNSSTSNQAEQKIEIKDGGPVGNLNRPSLRSDWIQDNQWQNSNIKASDKVESNEESALSDDWQSSSIKAPDNVESNENVDPLDDWNDFTSSSSMQHPNSSLKQNTDDFLYTEAHNAFPSTNNLGAMSFGSISQLDPFSGAFSSQNSSMEANHVRTDFSFSDSLTDTKDKAQESAEQAGEVLDLFSATPVSTHDGVENLMSQMHNLSFMLESSLSIPPKPDGLGSLSQN